MIELSNHHHWLGCVVCVVCFTTSFGEEEKRDKKACVTILWTDFLRVSSLKKFDFFRRMNFWSNKPKVVTRARKREREKERKKERKKEREDERKKEKSVLEISVFC